MSKLDYGASDEAIISATGKGWREWFKILAEKFGKDTPHKEMAGWLYENYKETISGWWSQTITVGYEYHIGRRVVGQTANTGWQVGISKTIKVSAPELWDYLFSESGLSSWLGEINQLARKKGVEFKTKSGGVGEIRSLKEHQRLRLAFKPADRETSYTMQIYLEPSSGQQLKTTLGFHFEKLDSKSEREKLRAQYREILEQIASATTS